MKTQFRYETHAHTAEISPCAHMPAAEMIAEVAAAGFDYVITTDHYLPVFFDDYREGERYAARLDEYFSGYEKAKETGKALGVRVLPAMEVRLESGPEDYLVFGIGRDELKKLGCLAFLTIAELSEKVRSTAHGLLIQAHPYRGYLDCAEPRYLDGVEAVNGNPRHNSHNLRSIAFARENSLLETAGSDVHQAGDPGAVWMTGPACETIEDFADGLRKGLFKWECKEECYTD